MNYKYEIEKIRMEPGHHTVLAGGSRIVQVVDSETYGSVMDPWYILTAVIETPVPAPESYPAAPESAVG
jgi:hypothetical protein